MKIRMPGARAGLVMVTLVLLIAPGPVARAASAADVERIRQLAQAGDASAQVDYGVLCENGDGVPQNSTEASKWYRRAAEKGEGDGAFRLGWLYARGEGLPQNVEQAARWYRIAADQGHAIAQASLGWLYFNGEGFGHDVAEAMRWFKTAANQGEATAQYTLGMIYTGAYGEVPKDTAEAAKWFRLAAIQGSAGAQFRLGALYAAGDGVPADDSEAYFWLTLALARLPDGAFKTEAEIIRTRVAAKLTAPQRADINTRIATWKPTVGSL